MSSTAGLLLINIETQAYHPRSAKQESPWLPECLLMQGHRGLRVTSIRPKQDQDDDVGLECCSTEPSHALQQTQLAVSVY